MEPLRVAVAGLGTVGSTVVQILQQNMSVIEERSGRKVSITAVSARSRRRERGVTLQDYTWFDNPIDMAVHRNTDVLVELIGGSDGIAYELCQAALTHGKHVVTANKALLAQHGNTLSHISAQHNRSLGWEAAVAGGIPIIKGLQEGLAANRLTQVHGILNGTCNYILSRMYQTQESFAEVLRQAQELGYAERDPTTDTSGRDTAHKLCLLAAIAFDCPITYPSENVEGILHITPDDILFAKELGYRIRLLGIARKVDKRLEQRVHPCLLSEDTLLASVQDSFNAVVAQGDFVDRLTLVGRGAGGKPTASAVVADIMDIARGQSRKGFSKQTSQSLDLIPLHQRFGAYYLRLMVRDEVGVLAAIARCLSMQKVSIEQFIQRKRAPGEYVPVVLTTHETYEHAMQEGLREICLLPGVYDHCLIRIESF